MHKVFISYHHLYDQDYKDYLVYLGKKYSIFLDSSVDTGDISDDLSDQQIRIKIRDEYLRDSTVTIVLVGRETRRRKHVDWEIYSSMFDGKINKRSGIIVINLPGTPGTNYYNAPYGNLEKSLLYPEITSWMHIDTRAEYKRRYPIMPERIIDNLLVPTVKISVAPWEKIVNSPKSIKFLIEVAFQNRLHCNYDLSSRMRRANS